MNDDLLEPGIRECVELHLGDREQASHRHQQGAFAATAHAGHGHNLPRVQSKLGQLHTKSVGAVPPGDL